jgi:hypothetical protein
MLVGCVVALLAIILFKSTVYSPNFVALLVFCDICPWAPFIFLIHTRFCNSITHSRYIFADHSKVFHSVSPATDCAPLLPDNDPIRGWCATNNKKLNTYNTRVITFTKKNYAFNCNFKLCDEHLPRN